MAEDEIFQLKKKTNKQKPKLLVKWKTKKLKTNEQKTENKNSQLLLQVICWPLKDQSVFFMAANSAF